MEPFELAVGPGEHPVHVRTARIAEDHHRVAFAAVRFSDAPAAHWPTAFPDGR